MSMQIIQKCKNEMAMCYMNQEWCWGSHWKRPLSTRSPIWLGQVLKLSVLITVIIPNPPSGDGWEPMGSPVQNSDINHLLLPYFLNNDFSYF